MKSLVILISLLFIITHVKSENPCKPEQIHISLSEDFVSQTNNQSPIKVIFHTKEACKNAYISLQTPSGSIKISASAVNYFQADYSKKGKNVYETYVHIFDFPKLEYGKTYKYSCYSDETGAHKPQGPFSFYVPNPNPEGKKTTVLMFGDHDHTFEGQSTLQRLTTLKETNFTKIAAYIHLGDLAYNLENDKGKNGDDYMKALQSFSASMPCMVTPGNHETMNNFSNFNMRFNMPYYSKSKNHYYSFNLGNIHFTTLSLDLVIENPSVMPYMLQWLEKDLAEAQTNRDQRPWIIVYTHRPLYCSKKKADCTENVEKYREVEELLNKYKVDLYVSGHVHHYERMLPIYKGEVAAFQQFPEDNNFNHIVNPQAPVYIVQGKAGHSNDPEDGKLASPRSFTVKLDNEYSFLAVHSSNSTHLHVENIVSSSGKVTDDLYIVKDERYAELPWFKPTTGQQLEDFISKKLKKLLRGF